MSAVSLLVGKKRDQLMVATVKAELIIIISYLSCFFTLLPMKM